MLKNFKISLILCSLFFGDLISAKAVFSFERKESEILKKYLSIQKQFSKKVCSKGAEQVFWKKNREYRKNKYHLPVLSNGDLDYNVIKEYLPLIKEKANWIKKNKKAIRKANFSKLRREIRRLKKDVAVLLNYKQQYFDGNKRGRKKNIIKKSKERRIKFAKRLTSFLEKIPFLLSFHFPVNHLNFRKKYDSLKYLKTERHKEQANSVYFYRKIVEDGAANPNHRSNDIFLRTTIDTIFLGINKNIDFITEELRYDLKFVLSGLDAHLRRGKKRQLRRLDEWHGRVMRKYSYYNNLVKKSNGKEALDERRIAHLKLKDFVLNKQAESYAFWTKYSQEMQALFTIETILFNEVGTLDGKEGLERKDITQVVINRRFIDEYTSLSKKDSIYRYLADSDDSDYPWLNLLFKEGEFSFSYFFIPATVRIFCPAMTRRAKKLRKQNVLMALDMLKKPNFDFEALRYFSRASMLGRIDMSEVWEDFVPIPERPGNQLNNKRLKRRYRKGKYSYLYHFSDDQNHLYKVISVRGRNYVVDPNSTVFYKYRNPHIFKYFSPID